MPTPRSVVPAGSAATPWLLALAFVGACSAASTDAADTEDTDVDTDSADTDAVPFRCPTDVAGVAGATVDDDRIVEASGLVASVGWPGGWWTHNDSGDTARVFYVDAAGVVVTELQLEGVDARDIEDLARRSLLHDEELIVGDIGDNGARRGDVRLYVFTTPVPTTAAVQTVTPRSVTLAYGDGVGHDAEALAVDPIDGAAYLVTKSLGPTATVFRAATVEQGTEPLDAVATLDFGAAPLSGGNALVTAADFSSDGRWFGLRTYTTAFLWHRDDATALPDLLTTTAPCEIPLVLEPQGESLALDPTGFTTLSEGRGQPLLRYTLVATP